MNMGIVGYVLSAIGVCLTIWSVWYARVQSKKISSIHRNEMISLWALHDRIHTLIWQIQAEDGDAQKVEPLNDEALPQVYKGLCDEYLRIVEMIVQKTPRIDLGDIDRWVEMNRIRTDWQRMQFVNLVEASREHLLAEEIAKITDDTI